MNANELLILLKKEFDESNPPPRGQIVTSDDFESLAIENAFCGKKWSALSHDFMLYHNEALVFMSPQAFHYYFPAYMSFTLQDYRKSDIVSHNIFCRLNLSENSNELSNQKTRLRLKEFTKKELNIVREYVQFLGREHGDYFSELEIKNALNLIKSISSEGKEVNK